MCEKRENCEKNVWKTWKTWKKKVWFQITPIKNIQYYNWFYLIKQNNGVIEVGVRVGFGFVKYKWN